MEDSQESMYYLFPGLLICNNYGSEGEVNPWQGHKFCRGQPVQPMCLGTIFHNQQAAMFQDQRDFFFGLLMFKGKFSRRPKA